MKRFKDIEVGDVIYGFHEQDFVFYRITVESKEEDSKYINRHYIRIKFENGTVSPFNIPQKDLKEYKSNNIGGGIWFSTDYNYIKELVDKRFEDVKEIREKVLKSKPRKDKIENILKDEEVKGS